ncbi:MAG: hypothetical protein Q8L48_31495 [Archangium sp.]|nr:hypothetical protein [Archangium sp.]
MRTSKPSGLARVAQAAALLLVAGVTLRAFDWLPRSAAQERRVKDMPSIEAVEQAAGRRLALPAWFPRSLTWPPSRVQVAGAGPDLVALEFGPGDGGVPLLVLAESVRDPLPFPPAFFPPGLALGTQALAWRGGEARLSRFRGEDGAAWVELAWEQDGQAFAFRSRGSLEQLLDLAASVHREGP